MRPLGAIAEVASAISGGALDRRLPEGADPDLAVLSSSFNEMVGALEQRIKRDARFASDVSHELRSPLTTIQATVEVLERSAGPLYRGWPKGNGDAQGGGGTVLGHGAGPARDGPL